MEQIMKRSGVWEELDNHEETSLRNWNDAHC